MAHLSKKKRIGLLLCLGAVAIPAAGWSWAHSSDATSTDNAYVRGDVTSLAAKVAGYVTAVDIEDNQTVQAGDVLFRIDDRDYRARLAQAVANIEAAQARLTNVDAESELQHALIRQAEAQKQSAEAELNRATKASDRHRQLIRSNAVSQAPRRAYRRRPQQWRPSSVASPSLPRNAKLPWRPLRRHRPHAISPRSIWTTP